MLKKVPRGLIFAGLDVLDSDAARSATASMIFDRLFQGCWNSFAQATLLVLTG